MCTCIEYSSQNKISFLARTMDFAFNLGGKPIVIPRNMKWSFDLGGTLETKYGFVGTGRKLDKYLFADGINEKGLAATELYFPTEATYNSEIVEGKLNLAPHEFLSWILGENATVDELKEKVETVNIVSTKNALLGIVVPLHFMISDKLGNTIVIESFVDGIKIKNNPVGVMTNSPELEWHLKNLNNYLNLQPDSFPEKRYGGLVSTPFGQGSGTLGLPGGYTGPERFIRTAYLRQFVEQSENTDQAIMNILHVLGNVTIPKGVNKEQNGSDDYTQYRSIMNITECIYYYNSYESNVLYTVRLTEDMLSSASPKEFDVDKNVQLVALS